MFLTGPPESPLRFLLFFKRQVTEQILSMPPPAPFKEWSHCSPSVRRISSSSSSDSIAGCTLSAQGLWLRMLCVMHTSRPYGCLEAEGKPVPDELLFRRCGCVSVEEYRGLLGELFSAGVPSRRPDGVIYSRRMVRDQQERDSAADRQRRHRSHASVTPMSQGEVRSQKSETEENLNPRRNPRRPPIPVSSRSLILHTVPLKRSTFKSPPGTEKTSKT